jgi:hypothetical protein
MLAKNWIYIDGEASPLDSYLSAIAGCKLILATILPDK